MRQTVVVDSSCWAGYVAASICVKQVKELEHRLLFLEICCPKPYTVYTDSQAAKAIADNSNTLGSVRHLCILTHLTRCYTSLGDIVTAAQESGLIHRFYTDCE